MLLLVAITLHAYATTAQGAAIVRTQPEADPAVPHVS